MFPVTEMMDSAASFVLTVAEGKRLIARGVAANRIVTDAMKDGMVAVTKGTTNAYVLEELLGRDIEKGKYVLGRTLPSTNAEAAKAFEGSIPEVVFRNGEPVEGLSVADAVGEMKAGDVVIKGANALDYINGVAGLLIGHPAGGTLGAILGHVYGKGLDLIIPVGLEKQLAVSMDDAASVAVPALCGSNDVPRLWPFTGAIYTEIEAMEELCDYDVMVTQIGSGGVCGAEGAIWLMAAGFQDDVAKAMDLVSQVQGEPSFWDAVMGG